MIRGYGNGELLFEKEIDPDKLDPQVAQGHIDTVAEYEFSMIEMEFLDEPDPMQRFIRFGTDPRRMVDPRIIPLHCLVKK